MNFSINKLTKKIKLLILIVISILIIISLYIFRSPEAVVESYITNYYNKNTAINYFNLENNCMDYISYEEYSEYIESLKKDTLLDIIDIKLINDETQDVFKRYECKLVFSNNDTLIEYYTVKKKYLISKICDIKIIIKKTDNIENLSKKNARYRLLSTLDPYDVDVNIQLSENIMDEYIKNSIKFSPNDPIAYYSKAYNLMDYQPELSIENFKIADKKSKYKKIAAEYYSQFYVNYSRPYYNLGYKLIADSLISIAIDIDPSNADAWYFKAIKEGDLELKIKYLKNACDSFSEINENNIPYYLGYAQALFYKYKNYPTSEKRELILSKEITLKVLDFDIENEEANSLFKKIKQIN